MSRVLIIDDHPIVLQGVRQLLEDAGVNQIVQTRNLADGFRLYRTQKPDVIIVDLAMRTGALGGLSFIRRLRLHDQQTPILVLTSYKTVLKAKLGVRTLPELTRIAIQHLPSATAKAPRD